MTEIKNKETIFTWNEFLFYILTILYPNYIIISYKNATIMAFNKSILKAIGLKNFVVSNIGVFNIIFWFSIFFLPGLAFYFKKRFENRAIIKHNNNLEIRNNTYKRLFVVIGQIVEAKRKRFKDHLEKLQRREIEIENIFNSITQPLEQIIKIFEGIKYTFSKQTSDEELKVSIIKCRNNKLNSYIYNSDDQPTIQVSELNAHRSTARQSISKKRMIVIESIEKNKKKWFYEGESGIKSIICYPVKIGKTVEFVISITSKVNNCFNTNESKLYELILDELGNRIILESYLDQIKDMSNEE